MKTMKIKQYFNCSDVAGYSDSPFIGREISSLGGWNAFFPQFTITSWSTDSVLNTLLEEYVWPEYYSCYIAVESEEFDAWQAMDPTFDPEIDLTLETKREIGGRIYAWLNRSMPVYKTLIANLEAEKSHLLDKISSQSQSRFNDTPQDGGDFSDDNHTTNITTTTVTNDVATPIARLAEIEAGLKNYYSSWSKEFEQFIIWSAED